MHDILVSMALPVVVSVTIIELVLGIILFIDYRKIRDTFTFCVFLLAVGLFADSFLLFIGSMRGTITIGTSIVRYFAHGILTPLLLPISGYAARMHKKNETFIWIVTILLMFVGGLSTFEIVLEPVDLGGVLRHAMGEGTALYARIIMIILSAGMVIPLLVSGVILLIREKKPHLLFSGLFMLVFPGLAPVTGNTDFLFLFSMFGEIFMELFLLLFIKKGYRYGT